jgi:hypothetical protein
VPRGTQGQSPAFDLLLTGLSPSLAGLSRSVHLLSPPFPLCPPTPPGKPAGLGCFPFARHYSGNALFSSGY